ncbi:twin-arginine translocase TatA/TatE family subunit [Zhongshania sp.]|uniref:twin-arginine translocase TatA/TatE family subunit n=1 Tax=Zhongshania sp. TaxID=1971902 RepID=UPI003566E720
MFDMSFLELAVIAIISLLVIGPDRLPQATRTGLLYFKKVKNEISKIRYEIEKEIDDEGLTKLKNEATSSIESDLSLLKKNWHKDVDEIQDHTKEVKTRHTKTPKNHKDSTDKLHEKK